ncbi:hypothetical protein M413DRAFT_22484 [Hebeloma cylindrosporum]|uniref:RNA helicase n=1 Tax=Hebeloma cylindrosporum TaxID=76867 RepID=A0A0C2YDM5_HEBCY|nr:hypothetical protein M413DRAFT_22484 [Hebeloma cylindrosporum h7]
MSSTYEAYAEALARRKPAEEGLGERRLSFAALGFEPTFVTALQKAFPNVQEPTAVQEKLIPEILSGKDILLKDGTGTGKSFGLVLALLNTPRVVVHEGGKSRRVVTTLFIVPHRDLAYQLVEWIERLASAFGTSGGLSSIVQVVVRGSNKTLGTTIEEIKETPPHILIGTPQGLLEIYREDEDALQLWTLSTVVVDEVDYLVETAARKEAGKSFHKAYEKAVRKVQLHPGPTREILDVIYGKEEERKERAQLIMTSATLRVHLKDYLFEESGWLDADNLVKIVGGKTEAKEVTHSILIATGVREEKTEKISANVVETIATAFAVDVSGTALLVVPASAGVQRVVEDLRSLGVDAEGLDVRRGAAGENPRLLVATAATMRGLDLPQLSHVFVVGLVDGRSVNGRVVDSYVHIAGRVGRFGGRGRVVSVVEDEEEAKKMSRILRTIRVPNKHFP